MTLPEPWTVTSSTRVHDDRWIHVRADACVDGAGRSIAPFYVLEQSDWVSIVALTPDRELVVATEYRHGAAEVIMGLPGGVVDDGEAPVDAAVRELREETGYASDRVIDLGWAWANPANQTNRVHFFLALDAVRVGDQELDAGESIAVNVRPWGVEGFTHSLHQLHMLKAERWLATAVSSARSS